MRSESAAAGDPGAELLNAFDTALPRVYGYVLNRCGHQALAEDLTAETFLAAVDAIRGDNRPTVSVAWLVGVARHKLVDHWRRQGREERGLNALGAAPTGGEDPWDERIDAIGARDVLATLAPTTGPPSPCATSTTCRCPTWPPFSTAPSTPPRPCSSGPERPSDAPTPGRGPTMADPFETLRLTDTPIDPDPAFATRLRARLERSLSLP